MYTDLDGRVDSLEREIEKINDQKSPQPYWAKQLWSDNCPDCGDMTHFESMTMSCQRTFHCVHCGTALKVKDGKTRKSYDLIHTEVPSGDSLNLPKMELTQAGITALKTASFGPNIFLQKLGMDFFTQKSEEEIQNSDSKIGVHFG